MRQKILLVMIVSIAFSQLNIQAQEYVDKPPKPPQIIESSGGFTSASLSWLANNEPDFYGYNVYIIQSDMGRKKYNKELENIKL